MNEFAIKLNIKSSEDWYNVTAKDIKDAGGIY